MGKVAEIKTKQTEASVTDFIEKIDSEQKRKDCYAIIKLMEKATKSKAKMWGSSIIGFGNKRFKSPTSGREVDWFVIGFSPRKANITLYLIGAVQKHGDLVKNLGKHKTGGGCIYINKLEDVDVAVLSKLVTASAK